MTEQPIQDERISKLKELATKIWIDRINAYIAKNPKSKTLKKIREYTLKIRAINNDKIVLKLARKVSYFLYTIVDKTDYVKDKKEQEHWLAVSSEMYRVLRGREGSSTTNLPDNK